MKNIKWKLSLWIKTRTMSLRLIHRECKRDGLIALMHILSHKCGSCGECSTKIKTRRQNTAYCDDIQNYTRECFNCHIEHESYWEERWEEYYSSLY